MKQSIFILLCLAGLLSSCNEQIKKERLQRIDSLEAYLPAIQTILKQVDSARIERQLSDIKKTQDWIFDNVEDTIPKRAGMSIADYMRSEKYLSQSLSRYNGVRKELVYTKAQILTLREDVKKSFYSDEEFEGYFKAEAEAVAKLNEAAGELATKHETISESHKKLHAATTEAIDSIKSVLFSDQPI